MTTSELTAPPEEAAASRSKTSGAGLLKWFWPEILGSVKGQLAETLDSGQSFGCRPMTLNGSKYLNQQIRPPLAAPMMQQLSGQLKQHVIDEPRCADPCCHRHQRAFANIR